MVTGIGAGEGMVASQGHGASMGKSQHCPLSGEWALKPLAAPLSLQSLWAAPASTGGFHGVTDQKSDRLVLGVTRT